MHSSLLQTHLSPLGKASLHPRRRNHALRALGSVKTPDTPSNLRKLHLAKLKKSLQLPLGNPDLFLSEEGDRYLAGWAEEAHLKPQGYDASSSFPIPSTGADVAAVSVGGRNNGQWKSANQDAFLLHSLSSHSDDDSSFLVGVFDGHGKLGHEVAERARASFANRAATAPHPPPHAHVDDHEEWLAQCFAEAANNVDGANADYSRSGAAAVVCSVQPGRVTAAWAGDSRAVLGLHGGFAFDLTDTETSSDESSESSSSSSPDSQENYYSKLRPIRACIPLTKDHKPDPISCPKETKRILASGGRVDRLATDKAGNPIGPFRVFLPDAWTPGLALSRAFGDHIARDIGIVPTPDLYSLSIPTMSMSNFSTASSLDSIDAGASKSRHTRQILSQHHRHVLVVASDGLWEWISSEEAVALAWQYPSAKAAAHALTERAQRLWAVKYRGTTCDDITVAVTFLPA